MCEYITIEANNEGDKMNKYEQDSYVLFLQNEACKAAKAELEICDLYLDGLVSEEEYLKAMNATEAAVAYAVSKGVSRKDLPAC